ncbi:MAG: HAD-IIIA family hydrolase [Alphaproteobacteria bacterium]
MPPNGDDGRGGRPKAGTGLVRAIFLDRDGVLIRTDVREGRPYAIRKSADLEYLPGAREAVQRARELGFLTVVVTNQPDVARGLADRSEVDAMHAQLTSALGVDDVQACFEIEGPDSRRYKPRPGMLLDAAEQFGIDLEESYLIGDRWRDIDAGQAAGCFSIFIDCGYDEELRQPPDAVVSDITSAMDLIVGRERD